MKKTIVIFFSIMLMLCLVSCGNKSDENNATASGSADEGTVSESTQAPSEQLSESSEDITEEVTDNATAEPETVGHKTLVVYYSASGNTEAIAGYIASATGADTFEIIPARPYSSADLDWRDSNSRVTKEHDDPALRVMELEASTLPNWDEYDTVFIGYPIWWGIAAWPVDAFIKANDFTGKTVISFCTSSSSGLGESGELLEEMAGTGNWLEGQRFQSRASEETVKEWVESLGL